MRRSSHRGAEIHAQWTRILCQRLSCPRAPATDSFTAATSYPTAQLNRGNSSTVAVSCTIYRSQHDGTQMLLVQGGLT
jgi:hypothetical protein